MFFFIKNHKNAKATQTFLKYHSDIIILLADKGNTTVSMSRDDYFEKANDIINDNTLIKKIINKDPTKTIQNKTNKHIDSLINNNFIDQ